jgi:hypothetical protein
LSESDFDTVYRYRSVSVDTLMEISTASFFASKPEFFNDPFDCGLQWLQSSDEELHEHLIYLDKDANEEQLNELRDASLSFQKAVSDEISNLGVTCFTIDPLHPLMWAHYGDCHRGLCIGYTREGILADEKHFKSVKYDRPKKVTLNAIQLFRDNLESLSEALENIVFRKLPEWSYENEWRLMVMRPEDRVISLNSTVESVTFGLKCPLKDINQVLNILRLNYLTGITKFYKVVIDENGDLTRKSIGISKKEFT